MYLVIADIGGTNARFELYESTEGEHIQHVSKKTYKTFAYEQLHQIVTEFLTDSKVTASQVLKCVLGLCGPVWDDGRSGDCNNVVMENGKRWASPVLAGPLETAVGLKESTVLFVNDFEAIGYCIASLLDETSPKICRTEPASVIHAGLPIVGGPVACVGAGTGLGACYLVLSQEKKTYKVAPSEAGMTDTFSPRSELEWELLKYLRAKHEGGNVHVDIEMIVSGPGLLDVYKFLSSKEGKEYNSSAVATEIASASPDHAPSLVASHAEKSDKICLAAVDLFLDVYGRTLAVSALSFLSWGGLYIAGGILPKLAWRWNQKTNPLLVSYLAQGPKLEHVVSRIPLLLLEDPDCGLKGCLYLAWGFLIVLKRSHII